jgi:hypothetical protein
MFCKEENGVFNCTSRPIYSTHTEYWLTRCQFRCLTRARPRSAYSEFSKIQICIVKQSFFYQKQKELFFIFLIYSIEIVHVVYVIIYCH